MGVLQITESDRNRQRSFGHNGGRAGERNGERLRKTTLGLKEFPENEPQPGLLAGMNVLKLDETWTRAGEKDLGGTGGSGMIRGGSRHVRATCCTLRRANVRIGVPTSLCCGRKGILQS